MQPGCPPTWVLNLRCPWVLPTGGAAQHRGLGAGLRRCGVLLLLRLGAGAGKRRGKRVHPKSRGAANSGWGRGGCPASPLPPGWGSPALAFSIVRQSVGESQAAPGRGALRPAPQVGPQRWPLGSWKGWPLGREAWPFAFWESSVFLDGVEYYFFRHRSLCCPGPVVGGPSSSGAVCVCVGRGLDPSWGGLDFFLDAGPGGGRGPGSPAPGPTSAPPTGPEPPSVPTGGCWCVSGPRLLEEGPRPACSVHRGARGPRVGPSPPVSGSRSDMP